MDVSVGPDDVVISNEEARRKRGKIDWDIVRATTEADIERQTIEDDDPGEEHRGPERFPGAGPLITELRTRFGLSQEAFATRFGISLRTLQQWEQKRRFPDGPTMLLLSIIRHEPEVVERVVKRYHTPSEDYGKLGG